MDELLQLDLAFLSRFRSPSFVPLDAVRLVERIVSPGLFETLQFRPRGGRVLGDRAVRARATSTRGGEVDLRAVVAGVTRRGGRVRRHSVVQDFQDHRRGDVKERDESSGCSRSNIGPQNSSLTPSRDTHI